MPYKTKHHNIWVLFKERYPTFALPEEPESPFEMDDFMAQLEDTFSCKGDQANREFQRAKEHYLELQNSDDENLEAIVIELEENNHPLNQEQYFANDLVNNLWLSTEYLKIIEAAALMLGRNPDKIYELTEIDDEIGIRAEKLKFNSTMRMIQRSKSLKKHAGRINTSDFIYWLKKNNFKVELAKLDTVFTNNAGRPKEHYAEMSLLIFLENVATELDEEGKKLIEKYLKNINFCPSSDIYGQIIA